MYEFQGRNGDVLYSIRGSNAIPEQGTDYFYVNPTTGVLSVKRSLSADQEQPDSYRVSTLRL